MDLETRLLAIEQRIDALDQAILKLEVRINAQSVATTGVRDGTEGILQRGKYAGRTHEWILAHHPDYIVWNDDNGYAENLGFTAQQIADARQQLQADPRRR